MMSPKIPQSDRQRGYSLSEVLVAVAIFALIILAALTAYDRSNKMFKQGVESSNMQQNTRVAFDKMVADLRMAGFDFDRDGIPAGSVGGSNQYQQPDEQFEYIGPSAIVIRGNFDYESEAAPCASSTSENCSNGREGPTYESTQFPVVTTGNDEIVAYALVPDSQTTIPSTCDPATNCIEFFADTYLPRDSYPDTGGRDEPKVQIKGVDLCNGGCNNPPYTLYRFTLDRSQQDYTTGDHIVRTPMASNIRGLNFTYYQDAQGLTTLKDVTDTNDVSTGATIRGLGPFRVSAPGALVSERTIRSKVNSIRIALIGMNEAKDFAYTDTAETLASARQYRKYQLDTLIAPRNIQKRGMKEQDITAPGAPTGVQVCTGRCGGVWVSWTAPAINATQGAPDQYTVLYDVVGYSGFRCESTAFTNTFGWVFGGDSAACGPLDPTVQYKFAVVALNSFGSNTSTTVSPYMPVNATRPNPPVIVSATTTLTGKVTLTWDRPTADMTGAVSCGPGEIPPAEIQSYRIERTAAPSGNTGWTVIGNTSSFQNLVEWSDTTVENCVTYRYRVTTVESCAGQANHNSGNDIALGSSIASIERSGRAVATLAPAAPAEFSINQASVCDASTNTCNVQMTWKKVTTDVGTPPSTINITTYDVERKPYGQPDTDYTVQYTTVASDIPASGTDVTWTQNGVDVSVNPSTLLPRRYEYRVKAKQCTTLVSGYSPVRSFPCNFGIGIIGTPALESTNAFDGDGSAATPWNVSDSVTVGPKVLDATRVASVQYTVTDMTNGGVYTETATVNPWRITRPTTQSSRYRFDAVITDTNGCIQLASAYAEDEAQACCLIPKSADGTVIRHTTGNDYVEVFLKNICGNPLELKLFEFTWDPALTPATNPATKIDSVLFVPVSGTTTTVNVTGGTAGNVNQSITPPTGTVNVPANSTTYVVRIRFNKALTSSTSPITAVNVEYRRPTLDTTNVDCPVVP